MAERLSVGVVLRPDSTGFREAVSKAVEQELRNNPVKIPTDLSVDIKAIREAAESIRDTLHDNLSNIIVTPTVNLANIEASFAKIASMWDRYNRSIDDQQSSNHKSAIRIADDAVRATEKVAKAAENSSKKQLERNRKYIDAQRAHVISGLEYGAKDGRNRLASRDAYEAYKKDYLEPISGELDKLSQQSTAITEEQKQHITNLASDARKELKSLQGLDAAAAKAAARKTTTFDAAKWATDIRKSMVANRAVHLEGENKLTDQSSIDAYNRTWAQVEARVQAIANSPDIVDADEVTRTESLAKNLGQVYKNLYQQEHPKEKKQSISKTQDQRDEAQYIKNLEKIQTYEERLAKTNTELNANVYKAEIEDLKARNTELLESISLVRQYNDEARNQFEHSAQDIVDKNTAHSASMINIREDSRQAAQNAIESAIRLGGGYDTQILSDVQQKLAAIGQTRTDVAASEINELNIAVGKLNANVSMVKKEGLAPAKQSEIDILSSDLKKIGSQWSALFSDQNLNKKYTDLSDQINAAKTEAELKSAKNAVKVFRAEVVAAGKNSKSFGDQISHTLGNITKYLTVYNVYQQISRIFSQMVDATIELDAKVTDLQIASGKTRDEVKSMVQEYAEMGKELGASAVDIASSADTFLRQGKSVKETNELIRDSMMLSKLGQLDSAEASKNLTSAMKGYKVEASDAIGIVDKLTKVDMEAAASAGGIATAMAETANIADLSGLSMDRLIGYLTTVIEITQAGDEEVGNFMKTLLARIGNIKAGNLYDPESAESLSDVETTLSGVGIALRDSSDHFRNFGDVIDETAARWDSLTSVQQRAIATAFAGTRQQEKFLVLMENYDSAMRYMDVSANSAGTATAKYNAYLDSIEAKSETFQAQFQKLSSNIVNSELIKATYDTGTGILWFLDQLVTKLGLLPTLTAGAGIGAFIKNIGQPELMGCDWAYLPLEEAS